MDVLGRRQSASLPAGAEGIQWIKGHQACEGWRLLNITTDRPLRGELRWGSALGPAPAAVFSVARSVKVCVFCQTWELLLSNLDSASDATVRAVLLDAQESVCPTLQEAFAEANTARSHTIPNWATDVRLDTADQALTGALIELLDADGTVRASITQTRLPPWIPLGSAASARVTSAAPYRLVWRLQTV